MKLAVSRSTTLICSSLLVVSLTGCATITSMARFDDRSDTCYSLRKPLIETENQLGQKMAVGGLIGAISGAGAAFAARRNATETIIAAIVGGIAGATVGYYQGMQQKQLTQSQMMTEIYNDAQVDARRVSETRGLIGNLNQCRNRQIDEVESDFRAGRITRAEMVARANTIRTATQADNELISTVLGKADRRTQTYVDAAIRAQQVSSDAVLGEVAGFDPARGAGYEAVTLEPPEPFTTVSGQVKDKARLVAGQSVEPAAPAPVVTLAPPQPFVATHSSHVRSAPLRAAASLGGLSTGQKVLAQPTNGEWMQIAFNGQPAFVHGTLLAREGSAAARTALQAASQRALAVATPPKPVTPVQEIALENRLAGAEAAADQQKISSRLNDLLLLGGQGAA